MKSNVSAAAARQTTALGVMQLNGAVLAVAEAAVLSYGACPDLKMAEQLGDMARHLAERIGDIDHALAHTARPAAPPLCNVKPQLSL